MARVFLMIRYPRELGTIGESDWDYLLKTISESQPLWDIGCALGAAVNTCETKQSPSPSAVMTVATLRSKYEVTEKQSWAMSTASAASYSSTSEDITQGFYCKSTPPYVVKDSGTLTPCIVVRLYQNRPDVDMPTAMSMVEQTIQESIYNCIIKPRCETCQISINDIYILRSQYMIS